MNLNPGWILAAAVAGGLSVAAGALGSHAAEDTRTAALLGTAAQYGVVHAAALLGAAAIGGRINGFPERLLSLAAWLFIAGLILFSGGIALYALTGFTPLVHIVPFGGSAYILGWASLGACAVKLLRAKAPPP